MCTVINICVKRYKKVTALGKATTSYVSELNPLGALLHHPALHKGLAQCYKEGVADYYEAEGLSGPLPLEYLGWK